MTLVYKERPGVEVRQTFRTQTPNVVAPALPACPVGPAYEIIEAVQDDNSLNPDATVVLPALLAFKWVGSTYASIGADSLFLVVNNLPEAEVVIGGAAASARTPTQLAADINRAAIAGILAFVETSGGQSRTVVRTTATGDNATLAVGESTDSSLLTALEIRLGQTVVGSLGYTNYANLDITQANYPAPRNNVDDLDIDFDSVRVFVSTGTGTYREIVRTDGLVNGAVAAVSVVDDGDGDNQSPYLAFSGANLKNKAATITGTVDLSALDYTGTGPFNPAINFKFKLNGTPITTSLDAGTLVTAADVVTAINTAAGATVAALSVTNRLVLTSDVTGSTSRLEGDTAGNSPASATLGFAAGFLALGTPSVATAVGTVDLTTLTYASDVQGYTLRMSIDGETYQQTTFDSGVTNATTFISALTALWGAGRARMNNGNKLELISQMQYGGLESVVRIDKNVTSAALLTNLGLTTSGAPFENSDYARGGAFPVAVGDEVYVDGLRVGVVTEIPASASNRVRLDREKALTFTGSAWFILAKNLDNSVQTPTRPTSQLRVDSESGGVTILHHAFYDIAGRPTAVGPMATYLAYNALRLDIAANGRDSALQVGTSLTQIDQDFGPIDVQNPFGLAMYFAKLTSGTLSVYGVGVNAVSTTEPDGTADAYAEAFEFLESKDVYCVVPLTHSMLVGQLGQLHVNTMSDPTNMGERVLLFNPARPTRKTDTVVASGPTANVSGAPTSDVNTGIADLPLLLAAAGYPGPTYTEDDGLYLELEDDTNKYLIASVSGAIVTLAEGPLTDSDSPFYDAGGSSVFADAIVDRPCSVKVLGAALANLLEEAEAYSDLGRVFADRRVVCTAPDTCVATIDGLDTAIPGYFANCLLAGVISNKRASDPLTETVLPGVKAVRGSNDRYSEKQLQALCGGGLWVFYTEGESVKTRQQLTTDMTTIEKQEFSITNALDYGAKTMRVSLRSFIGRTNLTTNVEDSISTVIAGVASFLTQPDVGVFASLEIGAMRAIPDRPDGVEVDGEVTFLYPTNKIRFTFVA